MCTPYLDDDHFPFSFHFNSCHIFSSFPNRQVLTIMLNSSADSGYCDMKSSVESDCHEIDSPVDYNAKFLVSCPYFEIVSCTKPAGHNVEKPAHLGGFDTESSLIQSR